MPHAADMTSIVLPQIIRDRIAELRTHPRQPYYEIIEEALDAFDSVMIRERGDMDGTAGPVLAVLRSR